MAEELYVFQSKPGVRRDGTDLDAPYYNDSVWIRWQRGKPRKMGGYKSMTTLANGPVRAVMLDARGGVYSTHLFSQWGIQRVQFASDGSAGAIEDRTPAGFTADPLLNWSFDSMYSNTGGVYSAIIASSAPDVLDIASDTVGNVYAGNIATNEPLVQVADGSGPVQTSGGICVLQPFLVVYGSNGLIRNSNANNYTTASGWTTGGSNFAASNNVCAQKIVYGQAIRGGTQAPAGLFWSLDSLVRMSFTGSATTIWQYDTLACPTTILSKNAIVEHEGKFFWPGVDRFMFYNGVVQELPNDMSANYFFDNLNWTYRNKVWGVKVARFGEIWWFYPRGTDTECGNAIIFNYRENTWYDAVKQRTAGAPAGVFRFPVWAGHEDSTSTTMLTTGLSLVTSAATLAGNNVLTFTSTTGVANGMYVFGTGIAVGTTVSSFTGTTVTLSASTTGVASATTIAFTTATGFAINNTVTGSTSGATGTAVRVLTNSINVTPLSGTFVSGETITGTTGGTGKLLASPQSQTLVTQYQQEFGWDKTVGGTTTAIQASYTSQNFGFAVGGPFDDVPKTVDMLTRITRLEPDMNQTGAVTLEVLGRDFAQDTDKVINTYTLNMGDSFQNMGDQARIMKLRLTTNTLGGFVEQGQTMVKIEPGDERSGK